MTTIDPARDLCGGAVAVPGDEGYDAARQVFNLAVDQRPAAVAFPADASEVADVVPPSPAAGGGAAAAAPPARAAGLRASGQSPAHNATPLGALARTVLIRTSG